MYLKSALSRARHLNGAVRCVVRRRRGSLAQENLRLHNWSFLLTRTEYFVPQTRCEKAAIQNVCSGGAHDAICSDIFSASWEEIHFDGLSPSRILAGIWSRTGLQRK